MEPTRCAWAGTDHRMVAYHDLEWGTPSHDDVHLFEMITLEGAQAGLSWSTILNKREGYRRAFRGFDPAAVARFRPASVDRLMADPGIVRNRLKVESTLHNAKRVLEVQRTDGSFAAFVWSFVGDRPLVNAWRSLDEIPSETVESHAMSKELKRRGFRFVGPTVCRSFMEAVGMINAHVPECFRFAELAGG
jgi:DNA-3-methyladenine glycosylase I